MDLEPDISVIVPNYNGQHTLPLCLHSIIKSSNINFELIVVDDGSNDNSLSVIKQFPCRVINQSHRGAAAARNAGAQAARAKVLLFTDADCVLAQDTLSRALSSFNKYGSRTIIGGSYNAQSFDPGFFSRFQSAFIHYCETKHINKPDYIATHAMVIDREVFLASGGFKENWLPILEDVEFSHRLQRAGYTLLIDPQLLVRHIFNFSLKKSISNAIRKASYWTYYSIRNKDLLTDSGTASHELKTNVVLFYVTLLLLLSSMITVSPYLLFAALFTLLLNMICNQRLLQEFARYNGIAFHIKATLYYLFLYPLPVSLGGLMGISKYLGLPIRRWMP